MQNELLSLARYINKKGIGYFIYSPSPEDVCCFDKILFKDGKADIKEIKRIAKLAC